VTQPAITAICSVRDGETFLGAALRSILDQTREDFELIVVDDGSTDGSASIVSALRDADSRVRLLRQENQGLTRSLNNALDLARGHYIARQDADDISFPERFERQAAFLESTPRCAVVGSRYHHIDRSGIITGQSNVPLSAHAIRRALLTRNVLAHSSVMIRRSALDEVGGFDETFPVAQDYALWCRLALSHDLCNLPDVLVQRRVHPDRIGAVQSRKQKEARDRVRAEYRKALLRTRRGMEWDVRLMALLRSRLEPLRAGSDALTLFGRR
jgi:glycosyltransferase involved in cell wall biosynthesis